MDSSQDLKPCTGGCGRITRWSAKAMIADHPDTVPRMRSGLCPECFTQYEKDRPMTQREIEMKSQLAYYIKERRKRLGLRPGLEQFRRNPIFGFLEYPRDDEDDKMVGAT